MALHKLSKPNKYYEDKINFERNLFVNRHLKQVFLKTTNLVRASRNFNATIGYGNRVLDISCWHIAALENTVFVIFNDDFNLVSIDVQNTDG